MASLTLAGIVYLLAIRELFVTPTFARRVVVIGLVLAAIWHIEFLRVPAGAGEDIHRYVWDGRLQRLGYNPYVVVPSDPAVQGLHTSETRNMSSPDLPSPYPPGGAAILPSRDRDSGVYFCTENSTRGLRFRNCFRAARCVAV